MGMLDSRDKSAAPGEVDLTFLQYQRIIPQPRRDWVIIADTSSLKKLEGVIPEEIVSDPARLNKVLGSHEPRFIYLLADFTKKYLHSTKASDIVLYEWSSIKLPTGTSDKTRRTQWNIGKATHPFIMMGLDPANPHIEFFETPHGSDIVKQLKALERAHLKVRQSLNNAGLPTNRVSKSFRQGLIDARRDLGEEITQKALEKRPDFNIIYLSDDRKARLKFAEAMKHLEYRCYIANTAGFLTNLIKYGYFDEVGLNNRTDIPALIMHLAESQGETLAIPESHLHPIAAPAGAWVSSKTGLHR